MPINLQKGQRISLSKEAPNLKTLMCGLGWDVAQNQGGGIFGAITGRYQYDLDASVICLDANGKLTSKDNIIYFGNLQHPSKAIIHQGDNLTGAGDGDDEVIIIDLQRVPTQITRLVFVINIYDSVARKQHFGQVENAFVRLVNADNNQELARYDLSGADYQGMTAMTLAEVYRHNHEWKMAAVGNGFVVSSLGELIKSYL